MQGPFTPGLSKHGKFAAHAGMSLWTCFKEQHATSVLLDAVASPSSGLEGRPSSSVLETPSATIFISPPHRREGLSSTMIWHCELSLRLFLLDEKLRNCLLRTFLRRGVLAAWLLAFAATP